MQQTVPLAARILLSLIFLSSALGKITNFEGTAGYMRHAGMTLPRNFFSSEPSCCF
jgi:uncharacterized membrane protein YphA (DoxX/SURF4 family)